MQILIGCQRIVILKLRKIKGAVNQWLRNKLYRIFKFIISLCREIFKVKRLCGVQSL